MDKNAELFTKGISNYLFENKIKKIRKQIKKIRSQVDKIKKYGVIQWAS